MRAHEQRQGVSEVSPGLSRAFLDRFEGASASLLARRLLQRRVDSKFLVATALLPPLLDEMPQSYLALRVGDKALATYNTLYFDTPELRCFHNHRQGICPRQKFRIRHYPDRELSFLEVKSKKAEKHTNKKRTEILFGRSQLCADDAAFLSRHSQSLSPAQLLPQLWTNFQRLTLLSRDSEERVTIDLGLTFERDDRRIELPNAAIIEVKQASFSSQSPMLGALCSQQIPATSISKYCSATILLGDPPGEQGQPWLHTLEELVA